MIDDLYDPRTFRPKIKCATSSSSSAPTAVATSGTALKVGAYGRGYSKLSKSGNSGGTGLSTVVSVIQKKGKLYVRLSLGKNRWRGDRKLTFAQIKNLIQREKLIILGRRLIKIPKAAKKKAAKKANAKKKSGKPKKTKKSGSKTKSKSKSKF